MIARGFFMVSLPLKRNHLMTSHSTEDVDRLVGAAAEVFAEIAASE